MLYEFKSKATGAITMTDAVGRQVLELIGKPATPQGIITADQLSSAISALEQASGADSERQRAERSQPAARPGANRDEDENEDDEAPVGLAQRLNPMIEMLKRAMDARADVTWGV